MGADSSKMPLTGEKATKPPSRTYHRAACTSSHTPDEQSGSDRLQFYSSDICPFAQRSWIALLEKNVPFDLHHITLENKPAYLKDINPAWAVPSATYKGANYSDSLPFNEFLNEEFPLPPLTPDGASADPVAVAAGKFKARLAIEKFKPLMSGYYSLLMAYTEAKQATEAAKVLSTYQEFDAAIVGPYFFGADVSLVDIAYYPFVERMIAVAGRFRGWELPAGLTKVRAWYEACAARPAFKKTSADRSGESLGLGCYESVNRADYLCEAYEGYAYDGIAYQRANSKHATELDAKTGLPVGAGKRMLPRGVLKARFEAIQSFGGDESKLTDEQKAAVEAAIAKAKSAAAIAALPPAAPAAPAAAPAPAGAPAAAAH